MLPPFASVEELDKRVPGGISSADEDRARALLEDASTLVREVAGKSWVTDANEIDAELPDVIVTITISAAKRSFVNPDMVRSESVDGYSTTYAASSPDVYLAREEKRMIRKAAKKSGLWALETTRGDTPDVASTYIDVDPPGEPMPYLGEGDLEPS